MSGSLNKVMLIGNLGDEVKMHHFDGGGCVGRFPIATNENYTNKTTGEKVSNTEWHNVVVKNKAAEKVRERVISILSKLYEKPDEVPDVTIGTHFLTTDQLYNSPDMEKPSTEYGDYFNPCIIIRKKKNYP